MRPELIDALGHIVGSRWVRHRRAELATYTMDGLPTRESFPGVVVMPRSSAEVRAIVRPAPGSPAARWRTRTRSWSP